MLLLLGAAAASFAQTTWHGGRQWEFRRSVVVSPAPGGAQVCVLEFLAHQALTAERPGLVVVAKGEAVPAKILQHGPGDFVRIAFATIKGEARYQVYYGGVATKELGPWTPPVGLVFECRKFLECDLTNLKSVQQAFDRALPLGADFVPTVFLGLLPFDASETPVLSRFTGTLRIPRSGMYKFYTTSHDASWLVVNGKVVVAWPGRHGATGDARHVGEIELAEGHVPFEYHYATVGGAFFAVAAWSLPGEDKIVPIPAEAFGSVLRVATERLQSRAGVALADFVCRPIAQALIQPSWPPLVKVKFDTGADATRYRWDFGDGQSGTAAAPEHVYLKPGLYRVRCSRTGGQPIEQLVPIAPPWDRLSEASAHVEPADWLPTLEGYAPATLPPAALLSLVRVYEDIKDYGAAAEAGLAGLGKRKSAPSADEANDFAQLAVALVAILDQRLDRTEDAWKCATHALGYRPSGTAALELLLCAIELALVSDRVDDASRWISQAQAIVKEGATTSARGRLWLLCGDLARRRRQSAEARKAYAEAHEVFAAGTDPRHLVAFEGAYSREIEEFLREGRLEDAADRLQKWAETMPETKLQGYYSVLFARCQSARGRHRQAILETEDLLRVAPASPYADRVLLAAAEAHARLGATAEAAKLLERIGKDYPGSPILAEVRRLQKEGFPEADSAKPTKGGSKPARKSADGRTGQKG
jgi:tetratricopeptide (TPR) repeat protein